MRLDRGRTYRAPEALWGRSMRLVDGRCLTPSARTVSHAWPAPARALAAVRGLRLYPYRPSAEGLQWRSGTRPKVIGPVAIDECWVTKRMRNLSRLPRYRRKFALPIVPPGIRPTITMVCRVR